VFALPEGPKVFSGNKVDIFDIFSGKLKVNEPAAKENVQNSRSPHHYALTHNYNNRSKCFSNEHSRSQERQLLQIEVTNPTPN